MKKLILIFVLGVITLHGFAQDKDFIAGIQFKAMLGNEFFNGGTNVVSPDSVVIVNTQNFGYVFGMTIRKKFTKSISVESGLRFVQRNYTTNIDSTFGNYNGSIDYRIIGYEIPLKGLITLRASTNANFLAALGGQIDLYPSDVYAEDDIWQVQVNRNSWIQGSFLANIGYEYHFDGNGTLYAGFAFNQPFTDPFGAIVGHYNTPIGQTNYRLSGSYLSLDIRYYFEPSKAK